MRTKRLLSLLLAMIMFVSSISITNFAIGTDKALASDETPIIELKEYVNSTADKWGKLSLKNAKKENGIVKMQPTTAGSTEVDMQNIKFAGRAVIDVTYEWDKDNLSSVPDIRMQAKTSSYSWQEVMRIGMSSGNTKIVRVKGNQVFDMSTAEQVRVTICLNFSGGTQGTYDVYLNGETTPVLSEQTDLKFSNLSPSSDIGRLQWYSGAVNGELTISKLQVYEGTKPRDLDAAVTPGEITIGDSVIADTPDVELHADPVALSSLFTVTEKEYVLVDGKSAYFYLGTQNSTIDFSKASETDGLKDCELGVPFEITLYKAFADVTPVAEKGQRIDVSLTVPDEWKAELGEDTKRIYRVFALDDSTGELKATRIVSCYEDVLNFEAVSGSIYVLGYVDVKNSGISMETYYDSAVEVIADPTSAGMTLESKENTVEYSETNNEFAFTASNANDFYAQKNGLTNTDNRYMVLQTKIKWEEACLKGSLELRGSAQYRPLSISSAGLRTGDWNAATNRVETTITLVGGVAWQEGVYYDVAFAFDWENDTADVYLNYEKVATINVCPDYRLTAMRIYMEANQAEGATTCFKNVRLYEGTQPYGADMDVEVPGTVTVDTVSPEGLLPFRVNADLSSAFTTQEKEKVIIQGADAKIILKVEAVQPPNMEQISDWEDNKLVAALKATLTKKVGDGEEIALSPSTSVDVEVEIPENMQGSGSVKRTFAVFEVSEAGCQEAGSSSTTTLTFAAKNGATYVFGYQDTKGETFVNTAIMEDYGWSKTDKGNKIEYSAEDDTFTMTAVNDQDAYFQRSLTDSVRHMVIEMTISWKDVAPRGCKMEFSGGGFTLINFNKGGIYVCGVQISNKCEENKEYKVSAAIDWKKNTVDAYLNGKLIKEDIKFSDSRKITAIRFYMDAKCDKGATACFKNIMVYEGLKPEDIQNGTVTSKVNVSGVPISVTINDSKAKLAYAMLDSFDLAQIMGKSKPGKNFEAILDVSSSKTSSSVLKKYKGGQLFDLKMTKKIGTDEEAVTNISKAINVTVSIPSWILDTPVTGKGRIYQIVSVSDDGTLKNITATQDGNKLTFGADVFSATYAIVFTDLVVGDKVILNTVQKGLAGLGGDGKGYVSESIDEKRMVYDYIKMPTQDKNYYLQAGSSSVRFMTVHMKLAWEKDCPHIELTRRGTPTDPSITHHDGGILRVDKGKIYVFSAEGVWEHVGAELSAKQGEYTEIALSIDWETQRADIYVNDMKTPILKGFQLQTGKYHNVNGKQVFYDFNYPKMFRLWMQSVKQSTDTKPGVDGTMYVKDWTIYESDVPKDINAGSSNALAKTGNTLFINTIRNGLKGISVNNSANILELRDQGTSNQHIYYEMNNNDASYLEFNLNGPTRYMIFQFKWAWQGKFPNGAFDCTDRNGAGYGIFRLKDNTVSINGATIVKNPNEGQYYDIAIALDLEEWMANVWLDGKLVKINLQLPKEKNGVPFDLINRVRMFIYHGNEKGTCMKIKDFVVYEGTSPKKITKDMPTSEIPVVTLDDSAALKQLGDRVAMAVGSDSIYYKGSKHKIGVEAYKDGETALFPVKAIAAAYGLTYNVSGSKVTMKGVTLPITKKGGEAYLSVDALKSFAKKALGGKTVDYKERGFVVIGNGEFTTNESAIKEVLRYLLYERPSVSEISSIMSKKKTHPRAIINADRMNSVVEGYKKNDLMTEWGNRIIKSTNERLMMAQPKYKYGDILTVSRRVYNDAYNYAMAYRLTGDMKYVNALYKVYESAAAFPDWNKTHFLDTAEMMTGFTLGYDWLYDVWTPAQRQFLEKTLYEKGLKVAYDIYFTQDLGYSTWWVKTANNWSAVCNGSILMTAVALYDKYPEMCAKMIASNIRALEPMMDSFYPSGAWEEGPVYWSYTMQYLSNMVSTMDSTLGTDFGISKAPAFENTIDYYLATDGPTGTNNYHDAASSKMGSGSLMWFARKFDLSYVMKLRVSQLELSEGAHVFDLIQYDEKLTQVEQDDKLDYYLKQVELVSLRESFEDFESAWVSYHAGEAVFNHSHLDTGSYVVDMIGERWAIDLGPDSYNIAGYLAEHNAYRKRPEGHNLYVINPQKDRYYPGQTEDGFTKVEKFVSKSKGAYSTVDLTYAYKRDVSSAKRGYMIANDRRSIVIRDEITFKAKENTFYWFNHINDKTTAEIIDKNTVKLTQNGQTVKLMIQTNLKDYELSVVDAEPLKWTPLVDGQNPNEDIHKIQIYSAKATKDAWVQVKFIPWDDPAANEPFENIPLSEWSIPDGKLERLPVAPTLEGIYRDGVKLYNFKKDKLTYTLTVPYNVKKLPKITAKADEDCNVEIKKAKKLDEYTEIKVSWKDCPESYRIYRVKVIKLDKLEDVYGYYRLQVYDHSASAEPEEEHGALNLSDNDLDPESRWVSSGENWACLDLGSVKKFEALALAWWQGDTRTYFFDIEISDDGENFTPLLKDAKSNGESSLYEMFLLDEQVSARYVRYKGYGNDENEYNSVTEFAVLTKELQDDVDTTHDTLFDKLKDNPMYIVVIVGTIAMIAGGIWLRIAVVKKKKKAIVEGEEQK